MNKIFQFFSKHFMDMIAGAVILFVVSFVGYYTYKINFKLPSEFLELGEFKGGIQNHLVWSMKGECYFVRPVNQQVVLLVRVDDCDKK